VCTQEIPLTEGGSLQRRDGNRRSSTRAGGSDIRGVKRARQACTAKNLKKPPSRESVLAMMLDRPDHDLNADGTFGEPPGFFLAISCWIAISRVASSFRPVRA